MKTGLAVAGGLLLATGLSVATGAAGAAGAAVNSAPNAAKPVAVSAAAAAALPTCDAGIHNTYEYYTNCTAGTDYYRTVAQCQDGNLALGAEFLGSSKSVSVSNCRNDSLLNGADNWGLLYCSNNTGTGTYQGYQNESGDISKLIAIVGNGTLATGANYICDIDTNNSNVITDQPPTG